jgi:hypothetical protein
MRQRIDRTSARRRAVTALVAAIHVVCALAYVESTLAQQQDRVTIDARRCREIESSEERLACFEAQVDEAQGGGSRAPAPAAAPPPSSQQVGPPPSSQQVEPPSSPQQVPPPSPQPVAPQPSSEQPTPIVNLSSLPGDSASTDKPGQSEWIGSITSLRQREPGQYVITLDTGQVWQQRGAQRYALRVGQRVRIQETKVGTRLQADGVNGYIHVERVR